MIKDIFNGIGLIKAERNELRKFGLTLSIILGVIGGLLMYKGRPNAYWFFCIGGVFFLLGAIIPQTLKSIYKVWMSIALIIGWFMSRLILSVLFYLVVTPIGVIMRLLGKDLLNQEFDKTAETYWIKKEKKAFGRSRYEKLF
jgi:polyferredoxin